MSYYFNRNGLSDIYLSSNDLLYNLRGSNTSDFMHEYFLHLTIHRNILFKHPDVSLSELRELTGDNETHVCPLLDVEYKATRLFSEELTMVISSIEKGKDGSLYVYFMLLCSYRLTGLFRNKTIDDLLLTI